MKVEELMTRQLQACAASDRLSRAAQLMWENDCGCVPVVEGDAKVVGMLTDRDICMAAYTRAATLDSVQASDAMSRGLFTCRPGDDVLTAQQIMRKQRVRRLPVVSADGSLVGIVSLGDIARALASSAAGRAQLARTLVAICEPRNPRVQPQSTQRQHQRRGRSSASGRRHASRRSAPPTEGASHG